MPQTATEFTVDTTYTSESLTSIGVLNVKNLERIYVEITNTGTSFDQFDIAARSGSGASYNILFNAAGDFTTPTGTLLGASGDLTALATGSTGWFLLSTTGMESIRLRSASAAATETVVNVRASGN